MNSIQHPDNRIPDEVADSFRKIHEAKLATLARQDKIATLARPNKAERRRIVEVRELSARARGIDAEMLQRLRDIRSRKFKLIREALNREVNIRRPYDLAPWDLALARPEAADPTFWWARTDWWSSDRTPVEPDEGSAAHFSVGMGNDGLKFTGGVTTHDGDLYKDSFGAVALFELQPERIPQSPSHRWRSTPHVEIIGGLLGYTGDDDISTGDLWSKCWMHLDHQIYQVGFGQDGPGTIVLGQAHQSNTLIFEENGDRSVHVWMPGFKWMPPVTFGNLNPASSLWARVEIRFDIQTEGAGTLLWIDPEVLLRTFQWPLTVL